MGVEVAVMAGSAIMGGINASKAASAQKDANRTSEALSREGLALQERQMVMDEDRYARTVEEYDQWKAIFGPLQEDLGTYYNNLTGTSLSNAEVARIQEASQKARDQVNVSLAQSGRTDSGTREYILSTMEYQAEIDKANIRSTAEERALAQKGSFLALGLNQANNISTQQNSIASAMQANTNAQSNLLTGIGANALNTATKQGAIWSSYTNDLQSLLGYGVRTNAFKSTGSVDPVNLF